MQRIDAVFRTRMEPHPTETHRNERQHSTRPLHGPILPVIYSSCNPAIQPSFYILHGTHPQRQRSYMKRPLADIGQMTSKSG
jgi:hypothetical protein